MSKQTIEDQIRARIETFIDELSSLVRRAAVEAVESALDEDGGRAKGKTVAGNSARKRSTSKRSSGKRIRRSSEEIAKLSERVLAQVKANPGLRMEELAKGLRKETKDLRRSVQDLVASKKLRTKGQKRATQYFPTASQARRRVTRKARAKS